MIHNNRPTYCLLRGNGASPVFTISQSGTSSEIISGDIATEKDIILTGGFSNVPIKKAFLLSAALQLNGDLAEFNNPLLKQFAEAELRRKKQAIIKSYTKEPDNLVCVLGERAEQLESFIDVYGGILQVEPLLLKSTNPGFDNVTELSITQVKNNYRIEYEIRSPVNLAKCTYCGECGTSCPEHCISETLFIDYSSCTFCKECEKSCPHNAIDIYAVEKKEIITPAVILLGNTSVDIPEQHDNVYHETEITKYLSTLFPYQIEETVYCNNALCQISRDGTAGCRKCITSCPANAISFNEKVIIDPFSCVDCGNCAGICPTGAIQYQRFPDESFLEFFRDFKLPESSTIVIGQEEDLHRFWWKNKKKTFKNHVFLEYPNPKALSLFHLLFLVAHGADRIILFSTEKSETILSATVKEANDLLKRFFTTQPNIFLCPGENYLVSSYPDNNGLELHYQNMGYSNRREKLSSILQFFSEQVNTSITFAAGDFSDFATVLCNEDTCTQCLACLNDCKIQSLTADASSLRLTWRGSVCIGCGSCVTSCPEDALSFGPSVQIDSDYFMPVTIAQAEPIRCRQCGKTFGTRKSFEHVLKILSEKNMANDGFFEYCEDCRVLKLLESE